MHYDFGISLLFKEANPPPSSLYKIAPQGHGVCNFGQNSKTILKLEEPYSAICPIDSNGNICGVRYYLICVRAKKLTCEVAIGLGFVCNFYFFF